MAETMYDDDIDDDTEDSVTLTKAEHDRLAALARKAKKADEITASAGAAQRELAFVKAGVDTDSPIGKLLLNGYSGELEVEAIKAEAVAVGAIKADVVEPEAPVITDEEKASTDKRADLAAGAVPDDGVDPDPVGSAMRAGREAIDAGAKEEAGLGLAFQQLASDERNWHTAY